MINRVLIIILDACGVGELPDAAAYGDIGAATIPNVAKVSGGLTLPNCRSLGLGNIVPIQGVPHEENPLACYGRMAELSTGKDSTSGHWEIGGIILKKPFPVYPNGFPETLIAEFEKRAGLKTIGNCPASGTEIIKELGARHLKTGEIILYTSADSVLQLAAHEEKIPIERLYEICQIARDLLSPESEDAVGRIIARPFIGEIGNFTRTTNRRDFSLEPPSPTFLDIMQNENIPTVAIGKVFDLFARRGFSRTVPAKNNDEVMQNVIDELKATAYGLIFANLVDFDMLWGHRNDAVSFGRGLQRFDSQLKTLLEQLQENDLLIITADHGCDPTLTNSTDHTREYVPLLVYNKRIRNGRDLGTRETFSDIAQTVAEIFELDYTFPGKSFQSEILQAMNLKNAGL